MVDMKPLVSESILEWISHVIGFPVPYDGSVIVKYLVHLTNLSVGIYNDIITVEQDASESCRLLCTFLDRNFHFPVSHLFSVEEIANGIADDEELFGFCLIVLLGCLQSKNKQFFMNAALELEMDKQRIIFHLVREPMTRLSADCCLTREDILTGFREVIPSPNSLSVQAENLDRSMVRPLNEDMQNTPIKSVSNDSMFKRPSVSSSDTVSLPRPSSAPQPSEISGYHSSLLRDPSTGHPDAGSTVLHLLDEDYRKSDGIANPSNGVGSGGVHSPADASGFNVPGAHADGDCHVSKPISLPFYPSNPFKTPKHVNSTSRRPTKLSFMAVTNSLMQLHAKEQDGGNQSAMAESPCGDSSDCLSLRKPQNLQNLASPLTSVKHLLDSPLWSHKIRLREAEREHRRLQTDLETERAYRDEAEHTVAELRVQLDEACKRAGEAESRVLRLTRQLTSHQDQQDELLACRTELSIREDEISRLKSRLTSCHDLVLHAKNLEIANLNLQQECADQQQKVDQLSTKLSEIKNRRMVCGELETLRAKLRDAEAQLAQHLLDSESAENEARRQQEMYCQLRLQHSEVEKRLSAKSETASGQPPESFGIPDGENLGAVLENELHSSQSEIARLKAELSAVNAKLSVRDTEVDQFTSRLSQLLIDLEDASAQREVADISLRTARSQLQDLQGDMETLQSRLEACHCPPISTEYINVSTPLKWPINEWNNMTSDLCEPVNGIFSACVLRFHEIFSSHLQLAVEVAQESGKEKERKVWENKQLASDAAHEALTQHAQSLESELASYQAKYRAVEDQLTVANTSVNAQTQLAAQLQRIVASLECEKSTIESKLGELQERSRDELQASRDLLDSATSRLKELESEIIRYRTANEMKDVAVSTESWIAGSAVEFPDDLFEADELDKVGYQDNNCDEINLHTDMTHHSVAYEAMVADRRGLSVELVRLHDELSEANTYGLRLEQQVVELQEKLVTREEDLRRQTALLARAQENWAIVERERRDSEQNLIELRNRYTMELRALGADLLPQMSHSRAEASATAVQIDAVRAKLEAERVDFKAKLEQTTYALETMTAEKGRLLERNNHLQHELNNLRSLFIKMATDVPRNNEVITESICSGRQRATEAMETFLTMSRNLKPQKNSSANANSSLEKWLEATYEDRLHRKETQQPNGLINTPSSSMSPNVESNSRCSEGDGLPRDANRVDVIRYSRRVDVPTGASGERYSGCRQNWPNREVIGSDHQRLLLSSHNDAAKPLPPSTTALTDPAHSGGPNGLPPPDGLEDLGYSAPLVRLDRLKMLSDRQLYQQPFCGKQELDTDADSSAYTDLSQVSLHSHPSRRNQNPPSLGCTRSNNAPLEDRTYCYIADHSVSPRKRPAESNPVPDSSRITELHRRNRLQPMHLRTSYPVETQAVNPIQVADALGHLSGTDQSHQKPPPTRVQENHVLREVGEENLLVDQVKDISPAAAGYRELPKSLHSITDALIAASDDPHCMAAALAAQLSQVSIQAAAVTGIDAQRQAVTSTTQPHTSLDEVEQFTRKHHNYFRATGTGRLQSNSRPSSGMWIPVTDENCNPPKPTPHFTGDLFVRPAAVSNTATSKRVSCCQSSPQGAPHAVLSSSDDVQSVCSSLRSNKSSVAFEIPIHDGDGRDRRSAPPRRVLLSSQQTGCRSGAPTPISSTLPRGTAARQLRSKPSHHKPSAKGPSVSSH